MSTPPATRNRRFIAPVLLLLVLIALDCLGSGGHAFISRVISFLVGVTGPYLPLAAAALAVCENNALITVAFPGSVAILGLMAYAWNHPTTIVLVWCGIFVGGIVGLAGSFCLGRLARHRGHIAAVALPKWFQRVLKLAGPFGTVLVYCHPHLAAFSSYVAGAQGYPARRFFVRMVPFTLFWYIFWGYMMRYPSMHFAEWPHWNILMYAVVLVWLMVLFGLHVDVAMAISAQSSLPPVRRDLDDQTRLVAIALGNLVGALAVLLLYFVLLRDYYVDGMVWMVVGASLLAGLVYALAMTWALGDVGALLRRLMGSNDLPPASVTPIQPWSVRIAVLLTTVWITELIFVTGGLAHSPFVSLGLTVVVVGQFISSARETYRAIFACGIVVVSLIEWILPLFYGYGGWIRQSAVGGDLVELRVAFWIMTVISMGIGVAANRQTMTKA